MAVQAQYPSKFLQGGTNPLGGKIYPSQSGGGGGGEFLHHTEMFLDGTNNNNPTRKRSRDFDIGSRIEIIPGNPPPFSSESQTHPNPKPLSTGLNLSFGPQKQLQTSQSVNSFPAMTQHLSHRIEQQSNELHNLLQAQGEHLRRTLAEKRKRHYSALLQAAEDAAAQRLRDKEAELEKAARLNSDLEARAAQLNVEVQTWQARAREQEMAAAMLQVRLQQAMIGSGGGDAGSEPACAAGDVDDAESAYIDPDRVVELTRPSCKGCRRRDASVVVLPCRHLCLCRECDGVAQICPICYSYRSSSVEAILC